MTTTARYPALFRDDTKELCSLGGGTGERRSVVFGRGDDADYLLDSIHCSRRQFEVRLHDWGWIVVGMSRRVPTLRNGTVLDGPVALNHGDRIEVEGFRFVFLAHAVDAAVSTLGEEEDSQARRQTRPLVGAIRVGAQTVVGRALPSGVLLDHPMVSRRHALLWRKADRVYVRDLGSQNGTWLDGRRVRGDQVVLEGSRLDIGPYSFRLDAGALVELSRQGEARIVARELSRQVRTESGPRTILDGVSLVIEPAQLTCLIGPSGSGKTTLLNALCARERATAGRVLLDGHDLYDNFELLKPSIALVPQQELLHGSLTVTQAVEATARLRLPEDTQDSEIDRLVQEALAQVELKAQAHTRVRDLSGGQRKRACLANEIVCKPRVLFLDEVTSGLDEQTDGEMMRLFRRLAHEGMTVICVTHTLANVESLCDTVVVMARGGVLAFAGSPAETARWFGVPRLAEVYGKLADKAAEAWGAAFQASDTFRRRMAPHLNRALDERGAPSVPDDGRRAGFLHQFWILTGRYARIVLADHKTLLIAFAQAIVVGAIIAVAFDPDGVAAQDIPERQGRLVFLMGICALWFGCNNAAKEIVKERTLYRRERDVNLVVGAYVASKLVLLLALGVLQTLVLVGTVAGVGDLPTAFAPTCAVLAVAVTAGTGLGLLISACCTSEDQAAAVVPMSVLPQILLANALVPIQGWVADASKVIASGWWSNSALMALFTRDTATAWASCGWLGLQAAVFIGGALAVLVVRDSR